MKTSFKLILFFVLIFTGVNSAQNFGINFTTALPQNEFKEQMNNEGFGVSGHFSFWNPRPNLPVSLGLNFGYINYGNETRREPFSGTIRDVWVNVDRSYNLVNFHLLSQIMPLHGVVRPYLEVLLGGSYFFAQTSVENELTGEEVASSVNFDDFAWSYGFGGGFIIRLKEFEENEIEKNQLGSIWLDLKGRYLYGSNAEYLQKGSIRIEDEQVLYTVSESKTDFITIHLGVVLMF